MDTIAERLNAELRIKLAQVEADRDREAAKVDRLDRENAQLRAAHNAGIGLVSFPVILLSPEEAEAAHDLATIKDITPRKVITQALRLYQLEQAKQTCPELRALDKSRHMLDRLIAESERDAPRETS